MSVVIPNPACAEQSTIITDTSSSIIWLEHTGTTEKWKGISWSGASATIIAVADVPWISTDSGDNWTDQSAPGGPWTYGPQALVSVSCSVDGGDPGGSVGETAVISANGPTSVYRWNVLAPDTYDTQVIVGANYPSASISDDGTHAVLAFELGGVGETYSNDDFNGVGTWITPGTGGVPTRVAAVSPDKSGGGYKVYFGSSPAAPFIVSGSALVWNAGIPPIVGSGSPALNWRAITLSKNGQFALAVATGEKIRTVSNFGTPGVQWVTLANSPALNWRDIAARRDLNTDSFGTIAAIEEPSALGSIWMSLDNGVTWSAMPGTSGKAWSSITCKSDGSAFAATVGNGNVWTYPFTSTTTTTTITGGPVPPRLWSRAQPDCIPTSAAVTQKDLDMRRKAEILQYKNNNSNMSKKQLWARTIKGHGPNGNRTWGTQSADGTYTNPNIDNLEKSGAFTLRCPGRPNNCAPTSNSDVPGKQMILCMRPDIPLTNYIVNRTYLAGGTKWPQSAWKPGDKGFPVGKAGRNLVFR